MIKRLLSLLCCACLLAGCASSGGGNSFDASTGLFIDNSPTDDGTPVVPNRLLQFRLTLNDQAVFDGVNGYYAVLINSQNQPIDPTNSDKFTDFILWDGVQVIWYNRRIDPESNTFFFNGVAILNQITAFSPDRRAMTITFNVDDPSTPLNQFIGSDQFTAHAVTTDRFTSAILGRALDTVGPGPSFAQATLYTVFCDKKDGAVAPLPSDFPDDAITDWLTQPDLDASYPYVNYDIKRFEVVSQF